SRHWLPALHLMRDAAPVAAVYGSHAKDAEAVAALHGVRERRAERDAEHRAGVARVDDAIVPDVPGGVPGVRLLADLLGHHRVQGLVLRSVEGLARALGRLTAHDREHARELLGAHDRDAMVRPGEEEARIVGLAGHAVVAGAVRAADHHGEERDGGVG